MLDTKICTTCGEEKELKDFYKNSKSSNSPNSYRSACKICTNKTNNKYMEDDLKNRDKIIPEANYIKGDTILQDSIDTVISIGEELGLEYKHLLEA